MTDECDERCFRCRSLRKVMVNMRIDDKPIRLCGNCYRDFTWFLEGCVVNPLVRFREEKE